MGDAFGKSNHFMIERKREVRKTVFKLISYSLMSLSVPIVFERKNV